MTDNYPTTPIPEPKWKFRRMAVFGGLIVSTLILAFIVWYLGLARAVNELRLIAILLIAKQLILYMVYLMAPTAEYLSSVTKLVQAAKQ
jgi:hypothetical protein